MRTTEHISGRLTWTSVVRTAAIIDLVVVLAVGTAQREGEALVIAAGFAVGLALVWRRPGKPAGRIVLGLLFADTALWMLPAAISGATHHDAARAVLISSVLAIGSVAGLAGEYHHANPATVGVAALTVLVLTMAAAAIPSHHTQPSHQGELALGVRDTHYSAKELAAPAGTVSVRVTNHDLFWHTFTVAGQGVDLKVPIGATRRVTFHAQPGTYTFYCRIPGHRQAGMTGTIVVR